MSDYTAECAEAGIDPKLVERYRKRLEKLLAEMNEDRIQVFGGGDGSSLRPIHTDDMISRLILADINAFNIDGGAGAYKVESDGLTRGE